MSRSPNTTTAPTGSIAPFGLRMLPELKEKLEAEAKAAGRSMNAEIVARLQKSFEEPVATEVPWDLRVEQRAIESRLETVMAHQMTLVMYTETLNSKYRKAVADGVPEEELRELKEKLSQAAEDERRIQERRMDLVRQSHEMGLHYEAASRPINERMEVTIDEKLQPEYRQLHDTESKLGIPKELRTVHEAQTAKPASKKSK